MSKFFKSSPMKCESSNLYVQQACKIFASEEVKQFADCDESADSSLGEKTQQQQQHQQQMRSSLITEDESCEQMQSSLITEDQGTKMSQSILLEVHQDSEPIQDLLITEHQSTRDGSPDSLLRETVQVEENKE